MKAPDLRGLGVPLEGSEPVFAEPWEAQAFALAVELHARGAFTWSEWAAALGAKIATSPSAPYYENWLAALEAIVAARGLAGSAALAERKHAWARAYASTPHGRPVELRDP